MAKQRQEAEWKVYYRNGFWKHRGRDRAGTEIVVNQSFDWLGIKWCIPAVYVCSAGLVADYCAEIDPIKIKKFVDKWEKAGGQEDELSAEERESLESESPFNIHFLSCAEVNGVRLGRDSGCSISWIPEGSRPEGAQNAPEAERIIAHYQLDQRKGWIIFRHFYPWSGKRKPILKSLQIHLEQRPVPVTAMKWKSPQKGAKTLLTHPATGKEYLITIQDVEKQELDVENDEYEYPRYFTRMTYTVSPELPQETFYISDCLPSDCPKRKMPDTRHGAASRDGAASCGIISGADGPIAFFVAATHKEPDVHTACSAVHFEPVEEVEWKLVYQVKLYEDMVVELHIHQS